MASTLGLENKVVLVTGGTKGIGRGIAQIFLQEGARVVVCARREPDSLPAAGDNRAHFRALDVRDAAAVDGLVAAIGADFGSLDVLINNAGGTPFGLVADTEPRVFEKILQLNLVAPLLVARAANAAMQQQKDGGVIINISSVSSVRPSPGTAVYGAAKAGLDNLTTSLAVEWAPKVRINSIIAGLIKTEMHHLHYGDEEGVAAVAGTIPLQRMGLPEDIGKLCAVMASNYNSYMSGANVLVHGGGEAPAFLNASTANKT